MISSSSWRGLPAVARRRRGPDRRDRLHRRLVHRLLRANPRRAARRQGARSAPSRPAGSARERTIYVSKSINILAAVVLYVLAVGDVQGFAFTLGLTTAHRRPRSSSCSPTRCCSCWRGRGSSPRAPLSGLDPRRPRRRLPRRARSSARPSPWRPPPAAAGISRGEAARRQTIAERKAAELAAALSDQRRHDRRRTGTRTGT